MVLTVSLLLLKFGMDEFYSIIRLPLTFARGPTIIFTNLAQ